MQVCRRYTTSARAAALKLLRCRLPLLRLLYERRHIAQSGLDWQRLHEFVEITTEDDSLIANPAIR